MTPRVSSTTRSFGRPTTPLKPWGLEKKTQQQSRALPLDFFYCERKITVQVTKKYTSSLLQYNI